MMKFDKKGFTLIELLVVITIIAILSASVLASVGVVKRKARDVKRVTEINNIKKILEFYKDENPDVGYPKSLTDLVPGYYSKIPSDIFRGIDYNYAALANVDDGTPCTSYHLAAWLEDDGHKSLSSASNATAQLDKTCDGSADDFDGTAAGYYDIKP